MNRAEWEPFQHQHARQITRKRFPVQINFCTCALLLLLSSSSSYFFFFFFFSSSSFFLFFPPPSECCVPSWSCACCGEVLAIEKRALCVWWRTHTHGPKESERGWLVSEFLSPRICKLILVAVVAHSLYLTLFLLGRVEFELKNFA